MCVCVCVCVCSVPCKGIHTSSFFSHFVLLLPYVKLLQSTRHTPPCWKKTINPAQNTIENVMNLKIFDGNCIGFNGNYNGVYWYVMDSIGGMLNSIGIYSIGLLLFFFFSRAAYWQSKNALLMSTSSRIRHMSQSSNHLRLVSWTWQWVHFTQMTSTVTRSQSNRAPLGCGGTGDSHHGCAADKSAATVWCYHINMDQNLWGMF